MTRDKTATTNYSVMLMVFVESRRPPCWSCGAAGHLYNTCPVKNSAPTPTIPATPAASNPAGLKDAVGAEMCSQSPTDWLDSVDFLDLKSFMERNLGKHKCRNYFYKAAVL